MLLRRTLEEVREETDARDEDDGPLRDTFSDEELADVDRLVLDEGEMEKRSALFYTMYKSKLDQPPREPKQKKQTKKAAKAAERDAARLEPAQGEERARDDDELVSDGGNFDDFESG
jgi:hypothetical protein